MAPRQSLWGRDSSPCVRGEALGPRRCPPSLAQSERTGYPWVCSLAKSPQTREIGRPRAGTEVTASEAPEVKSKLPVGDLYEDEASLGLVFLLQNGVL